MKQDTMSLAKVTFTFTILALLLTGCNWKHWNVKQHPDLPIEIADHTNKNLKLLSAQSIIDEHLAYEFRKQGFSLSNNNPLADMGVRVSLGDVYERCPGQIHVRKTNHLSLELINLKKQTVVAVFEGDGWLKPCGTFKRSVTDDLVAMLASHWEQPKAKKASEEASDSDDEEL